MSFTYTGALDTDLEKVRFYIGDTDSENPLFTDEEILAVLVDYPSVVSASIQCVEALIAKYSRYASEKVGEISVNYDKLVGNYLKLLATLRRKAITQASGAAYSGGISKADKELTTSNTDNVEPAFTVDMFKNEADDNS